jgi:hypothetical protein
MCPLWRHAARRWGPSADVCLRAARQCDPTLRRTMLSAFSSLWGKAMSSTTSSSEMGHGEYMEPSTIGDRSFHWMPSIPVKGTAFATSDDGFHEVQRRCRSILHHPVGLPLACLLNEATSPTVKVITNMIVGNETLSMEFNKIVESRPSGVKDIQELLKSWVLSSHHSEPNVRRSLTDKLCGLLHANETPTLPSLPGQATHTSKIYERDKYGRIGILIRRHLVNSADPVVLLIEAGLRNEDWWLKVDQSLVRIKRLGKAFSEPLLLAVFTVSRDEELNKFRACLGVFLVTPKENKAGDFRLSLLLQRHCFDLIDLAGDFERITQAMVFLAKWNENLKSEKLNHEYLSPHCCRIGDLVSHVADEVPRIGMIHSLVPFVCPMP